MTAKLSADQQKLFKVNMNKSTALIPVFAGVIGGVACNVCDARALHTFLQVGKDFSTWIKDRIKKYGFVEGEDFVFIEVLSSPNLVSSKSRPQVMSDYRLTLDTAKEMAMVEKNEQGKQARRYFIECERRAHSPESNTQNGLPKDVQKACDFVSWREANEYQRHTMNLIGSAARDGDEDVLWMTAFLIKGRLYDRLAALAIEHLTCKSTDEVTDWILAWKPAREKNASHFISR